MTNQTAVKGQGQDTSVMGLTGLVGRNCLYTASIGISVECCILNVKSAYGSIRVEISPLAGNGRAWVMLDSVRMTENL